MATVAEMLRRVKSVNIDELAMGIIESNKDKIVEKNQAQLEYEGINSKGNKLRRYASNSYAARKQRINGMPGFGVPDLRLTGAFYRGFTINVLSKKEFEITSTDSKTTDLTEKYGEDIFGLIPRKKLQVKTEIMMPQLRKQVKAILKV